MHLSTLLLGTLSLLVPSTTAWRLTAYVDVNNCVAQTNSVYRILEGPSNLNNCFTFGNPMPGTTFCREYQNGGGSNGPCTAPGPTKISSAGVRGTCTIYEFPNCQGNSATFTNQCQKITQGVPLIIGWVPFSSYRCSGNH
ncbi:hypothetical protein QBC38DRAFT_505366 [Podospora fimiseda]|uniref:Secreted LysM effector LysM C-terminal domain-containing protein n=1 Tax=Podospora fimiseda TaxID=252190 RepID=A0AAN6YQD6_9PEZI|nr:hypothetical protein QBC38DRAFT_505366 [Podospora fimiseda]